MAKDLVPLTIGAPGFLGLNTQQSGSILPPGWATKLTNFVFDDVGRIASREGSQQVNGTVITNTPTVKATHEYIDASGNVLHIVACDNKIYKEVSGTMTDISGTITTPTADNWKFVNFNGWCVGMQASHAPVVLTTTGGTFADSGGTQYNGETVLSAYGRLWTVSGNELKYSDLLLNNFTGGSSGAFDLSKFWPNGMDTATALVDFNGLLIVFGKQSIIIYENADDVSNMAIVEGISGIGCVARDTVQVVGNDVVFLSDSGLRSLSRSIQEESMPMTDISKHVRDSLVADFVDETSIEVKSVYNEIDGFYLISLPTAGKSYYFDLKFPNEDGTWKATTWDIAPTALSFSSANVMYMAVDAGYISKYTGYRDGDSSAGSGGSAYTIDYEGVWNDFGDEVSNYLKILKSVSVLGAGTPSSSVSFKWAVDYEQVFRSRSLTFNSTPPAAYGTAQYSVDVFAATGSFERVRSNLSVTGQVMIYGITATISGSSFALQRMDVLAKIGRLSL
jgi:hypothetical protein